MENKLFNTKYNYREATPEEIESLLNLQISKLEMRKWCKISTVDIEIKQALIRKMIDTKVHEVNGFTLELMDGGLGYRKIPVVYKNKLSKKIMSEMKNGKVVKN
jgi:hypothetical protein